MQTSNYKCNFQLYFAFFSGAMIARKKHKDKTDIRQYLKRSFHRVKLRSLVEASLGHQI